MGTSAQVLPHVNAGFAPNVVVTIQAPQFGSEFSISANVDFRSKERKLPPMNQNEEINEEIFVILRARGLPRVLRAAVEWLNTLEGKWTDTDMLQEIVRRRAILIRTINEIGSGE